ncbi:MAG: glycosyltransferase family 4 protein [bacterium]
MHIGIAGPISINNIGKILDIEPNELPDGLTSTNVPTIIEGLLQLGHHVSVYTLSKNVKSIKSYYYNNCSIHFGEYRQKHRARDFFRKEINAVEEMIKRDPPEIVHAHWSYEFALGAINTNIPSLVTLRDWAPEILRLKPDMYRFIRLLLNSRVLKKTQFFTANSPYIQKLASNKLNREVPLIPNPISGNYFAQFKNKSCANKRIIAVNNSFCKRKNVCSLLKALPVINAKIPEAELFLIGTGYEQNGVAHKWVVKQGINTKNIHFFGPVTTSKLIELYDESSLMVHPSLEESFGNILIEAMARKLPVIGGCRSGAVPWVLDYGKAGLLVDVKDPLKIAEGVLKLFSDMKLWHFYSQAGYDNAYSRFRLGKIIGFYLEEYGRVLKKWKKYEITIPSQ